MIGAEDWPLARRTTWFICFKTVPQRMGYTQCGLGWSL